MGRTNSSEGINGMLPKDADIQKEVEDAMHEVSNYQFDNMEEEEIRNQELQNGWQTMAKQTVQPQRQRWIMARP